jgi:hypothetical protein
MKLLPWLAAGVFGGFVYYAVITGKLESNGKFLGFIPENNGFGLEEIAKGLVIVGGAALIGKAVHGMVPAIPAGKI